MRAMILSTGIKDADIAELVVLSMLRLSSKRVAKPSWFLVRLFFFRGVSRLNLKQK